MRTWMIHEVNPEIMDFIEKNVGPQDILTFDDGLYSQWLFHERMQRLGVELIYYIPTGAVRPEGQMAKYEFPTCEEAMERWTRNDDKSAYMSWDEIEDLMVTNHSYVGGHSHNHTYDYGTNKKLETLDLMGKDVEKMKDAFRENLGYVPFSFCFPYNKGYGLESVFAKKHKVKIFTEKRIDIRDLMNDPGYANNKYTQRTINEKSFFDTL